MKKQLTPRQQQKIVTDTIYNRAKFVQKLFINGRISFDTYVSLTVKVMRQYDAALAKYYSL